MGIDADATCSGPLAGLKIVEFAGLGPGPFCGMLLSDLGADVVRIDRPDQGRDSAFDTTYRGRRSVLLDLKAPAGRATALRLIEKADALIEGYRPGVMERLGLGPDEALAHNGRLVYGRMTGWGQSGPLAAFAGHDINYIALTGALHAIGPASRPVPPLNLIGDFGGGALYMAFGLLAGVLHARATGEGQVIDCSMAEGAASLLTMQYGRLASGDWLDARASNYLDGGAHFYGTYACADGGWLAVGAIEPQFYRAFLAGIGLAGDPGLAAQWDRSAWPRLRERIAAVIATRTRDEWCAVFAHLDACVSPVLNLSEAPDHPHHLAREAFAAVAGVRQPGPCPRFSRTPGRIQGPPPKVGQHQAAVFADWGLPPPPHSTQ